MGANSTDFKAIILAGGSGERFWPLSTPERPKQFLRIFGDKSLLRQSVDRLAGLVESKNIYVVTSAKLKRQTQLELPEVPAANIIGEPMRRDTGAAIALGVARAKSGVLGFFPADQIVAKEGKFRKALTRAIKAARDADAIVTLGIKPDSPSTAFGYIDPKNGKFVEKPNLNKAKTYIRRGYLWNAGMFIARADTFRMAFAQCAPRLMNIKISDYPKLEKISFDYAIMEKFANIKVIEGDFGWDDVGSYAAFERYFPNKVDGDGNLIISSSQPIKCLGVRNLVIVATKDGVLVIDKSHLDDMKRLFK